MLSDGKEAVEINYCLAYDEVADLAILQCESGLTIDPIPLGNSDAVKQGDDRHQKLAAAELPLQVCLHVQEGKEDEGKQIGGGLDHREDGINHTVPPF